MITLLNIDPKLYVIIGIFTTAIAQISLKQSGGMDHFQLAWFLFIFFSITFYLMSFVSYYFALRSFDISTVQPIMMVSIVALITLYGFFAGENFNLYKVSGIIMACLSIVLISKS